MPVLDFVPATVTIPGSGELLPSTLPVPFAPTTYAIWNPLGFFVTGVSTRYEVDLRRPRDGEGVTAAPAARGMTPRRAGRWVRGNEILSIRRNVEPIPVTDEERKEQAAILLARGRQRDRRWNWDVANIPASKPAYRGLHVGEDGRIWVLLSAPSVLSEIPPDAVQRSELRNRSSVPIARWVEPTHYDIFEPNGVYVGQVEIPVGLTVHVTRGDTLWASSQDADDVPIVHRLHIVWP
jgi:hypothetical protein